MRARGVASGMALPRLFSSQISCRIAAWSAVPGANRRENADSGWSVISHVRRSTPISSASFRAWRISSVLSFHLNRMYRQLMKGRSRPARRFSRVIARMVCNAASSRPRRRYRA